MRGRAVSSLTLLARYVPTNLALAMSRMALAEREGVPKRVCMASIVYELGFTLAGSAAVGAYFVVGQVLELAHGTLTGLDGPASGDSTTPTISTGSRSNPV